MSIFGELVLYILCNNEQPLSREAIGPHTNFPEAHKYTQQHGQETAASFYNVPPPSYNNESSKNFQQHNQRKQTNDGLTFEAGLSGVGNDLDNGRINEIKTNLQTDRQIRMAFVRKVYFLLTLQLLCTIIFTVWFMFHEPVKEFVQNNTWLFLTSWIMTFVSLILLFWKRKAYPLNLFLLLIFTIFISYGIGTVVSMYNARVVLQSFVITFGVFIALQVFTLQSKFDFSSWGPFLYAGLWVIIFASIIGWLFPYDRGYHIVISVIAAFLFSAYIIYDTYMIFKRMSPEEYVMAAVDLYLDILNLFVVILALFGGASET
ncbi:hypothetical protein Glove_429g48 [Diversispora epigaea]|uniref:Uncharacterized protein n=1 Tax=Diversispora epigaea TaxID=1348612 RepID=A0A397H1E1_9GLOM|nr:hypothetical protein Glove_429g48 [Diversispora epigaea]